jgi:hypothetical protein
MDRLLAATYKTLSGAQKRCSFENAIAASEARYNGGKLYRYEIVRFCKGIEDSSDWTREGTYTWRIRRYAENGK